MILILIALIVLASVSVYGVNKDNARYLGPIFGVGMICYIFGLIMYSALLYNYISAGYKADIINREYNTNYTQAEIFYATYF